MEMAPKRIQRVALRAERTAGLQPTESRRNGTRKCALAPTLVHWNNTNIVN